MKWLFQRTDVGIVLILGAIVAFRQFGDDVVAGWSRLTVARMAEVPAPGAAVETSPQPQRPNVAETHSQPSTTCYPQAREVCVRVVRVYPTQSTGQPRCFSTTARTCR
ncbi:MAG: hypothetical protein R3C01_09595 [Planctomycetaceae bacterium]